jgi:hypothetical protein
VNAIIIIVVVIMIYPLHMPKSSSRSKSGHASNSSSPSKSGHKDSQDLSLKCPTKPSSHSKSRNMSSSSSRSKSGHKDSQELALECPTTPSPPSSPKPNQAPSKRKKQDRHEKERKLFKNTVQALSKKLKKRDRQEQQLQEEEADKFIELTLHLESAEDRLVEAAAENQTLSRRIENLQSTIDLEGVRGSTTSRKDVVEITKSTRSSEQRIDEAELHEVKLQRDSALLMASEMAMAVAECRTESDELRDQLAAITALLQHKKCGSSSVPEAPVFVHLLRPAQGDVYA